MPDVGREQRRSSGRPPGLAGENAVAMPRSSASQPNQKRAGELLDDLVLARHADVHELVELVGRAAVDGQALDVLERIESEQLGQAPAVLLEEATELVAVELRRVRALASPRCCASPSARSCRRAAAPPTTPRTRGTRSAGRGTAPAPRRRAAPCTAGTSPARTGRRGWRRSSMIDAVQTRAHGQPAVERGDEAQLGARAPDRVVVVIAVEPERVEPVRLAREQPRAGPGPAGSSIGRSTPSGKHTTLSPSVLQWRSSATASSGVCIGMMPAIVMRSPNGA